MHEGIMTAPTTPTLPDDIKLIDDMHLGQRHVIGSYLLLGDEPALVDPGPTTVLPTLEAGLAEHGMSFSDIRALLLTHIHLDHAGATGTLVSRYPHLHVYVHERGAPHMIAPERLLRSAERLYGDDMGRLWGEFLAVPEQNITTLAGGETLRLGGRTIQVHYAPGHASHHVMYFDEGTGAVFVGDTAGARMPGFSYARPATPPPDIDLESWRRSLDTMRDLDPSLLLLTHFGPVANPQAHIEAYWERLQRWAELVRGWTDQGLDEQTQIGRLRAVAAQELGQIPPIDETSYQRATPIEQSWQGLARYWRKRAEREANAS
jgi:glyoxylase-like metal-dependent hydrolase (beta-lactamase superfamily II)